MLVQVKVQLMMSSLQLCPDQHFLVHQGEKEILSSSLVQAAAAAAVSL